VALPCNVETLKTNDNATYYKSADVGHMLVVYEVGSRPSHVCLKAAAHHCVTSPEHAQLARLQGPHARLHGALLALQRAIATAAVASPPVQRL
jgi:TATA-binding protein-associated factor Taf7